MSVVIGQRTLSVVGLCNMGSSARVVSNFWAVNFTARVRSECNDVVSTTRKHLPAQGRQWMNGLWVMSQMGQEV